MSEEQEHGEELFSAKVAAGSRTYFFDVQQASTGAKYLKISESSQREGKEYEHNRVMVFEDHWVEFLSAFNDVAPHMRPDPLPGHLSEVRRKFPRAYEKWTTDEDTRLHAEFAKGTRRVD